jgi:hypothetical protein
MQLTAMGYYILGVFDCFPVILRVMLDFYFPVSSFLP